MLQKFLLTFCLLIIISSDTVFASEEKINHSPQWEYIVSSNDTIYYIDINRNNIIEPDQKTIVFNMAVDNTDLFMVAKMNVRSPDDKTWLYRMEQYSILDKKSQKTIEQSNIPTYWEKIEDMNAPIIQGLAILAEKYPGL